MCNSFVTTVSVTKRICNKVVCNKGAKNRLLNFLAALVKCYKVLPKAFPKNCNWVGRVWPFLIPIKLNRLMRYF